MILVGYRRVLYRDVQRRASLAAVDPFGFVHPSLFSLGDQYGRPFQLHVLRLRLASLPADGFCLCTC